MSSQPPPDTRQSETSVISGDLDRLYERTFGRGPRQVRTFVQPECAICVLRSVLTPAERVLVADGGEAEVEAARRWINDSIEEACIEIVEAETRRSVGHHRAQLRVRADLVVHLFYFDET